MKLDDAYAKVTSLNTGGQFSFWTRLKVAIRPTISVCDPSGRGVVPRYLKVPRTARALAYQMRKAGAQTAGREFARPHE